MLRTLLFGLSVIALPVHAAGLFSPVSPSLDLSNKQEEHVARLRALPSTEAVTMIKVDEKQLRSNESIIQITLAPDKVFDLVSNQLKRRSRQRFAWNGATDKSLSGMGDLPDGDATFFVNGSAVSGSIRTSDGVYSVHPLTGGLHALVRVREDALPPEHPPTGPSNIPLQPVALDTAINPNADVSDSLAVEPVSVMIVYSKDAAENRDPVGFAGLMVAQTNRSYEGSDIPTLKLSLAGTYVSKLVDSGSDNADLGALVAGKTPETKKVQRLREKLKADLVILISNNSAACGLAQTIYANADSAYATVYHACATDNLSFAHEIGHLLGACHDPDQGKPCSPFVYGHGFQRRDAGMRTIMAYQCANINCRRMPEWARPPLWGDETLSHDARVMKQSAERAATFR